MPIKGVSALFVIMDVYRPKKKVIVKYVELLHHVAPTTMAPHAASMPICPDRSSAVHTLFLLGAIGHDAL